MLTKPPGSCEKFARSQMEFQVVAGKGHWSRSPDFQNQDRAQFSEGNICTQTRASDKSEFN